MNSVAVKGEEKALGAAVPDLQKLAARFSGLKVAIVHYWLVTWRGGEKVVESLLKLFPDADIYTLFYDPSTCRPYLGNHRVFSSTLDTKILRKQYQKLFPLYPAGIRSLKLQQEYDLIVSSESGPAKGIAKPVNTPHLCYIHTPMRYCWGYTDAYLETLPAWVRGFAAWQFERLRKWDTTTVDNADRYVANSRNVADRVQKYYQRTADVCYPPIALDLFESAPVDKGAQRGDYYLSFGAITPYKNIDLLVEAFNRTDRRLIVVGDGSERQRLEQKANGNIEFKGALPFSEVIQTIRGSKALLFPGEEDLGMVPLEVMSQGIPVIAYRKGGALETVIENLEAPQFSSGLFFDAPETNSLLAALERFESLVEQFDPCWIQNHARLFGEDHFLTRMSDLISDLLGYGQ